MKPTFQPLRRLLGLAALLAGLLPALSAQPLDWQNRTSPPTSASMREVFSTPGLFLAVGDRGTLLVSPDGTDWTPHAVGVPHNLTSAAYGNGQYLVADDAGFVYSSTDTVNWSVAGSAFTSEPISSSAPSALAYGNGVFVRVILGRGVSSSVDGVTWLPAEPTPGSTTPSLIIFGYPPRLQARLRFDGGKFYLLGSTQLWTSSDGTHWESLSLTASPAAADLAIGNGRFVISRSDAGITYTNSEGVSFTGGGYFSSADGVTWTARASPSLDAVNFVNGQFYGRDAFTSALLTSVDGLTWTPAGTATPSGYALWAVFDGVHFATVFGQKAYSSSDSLAWTLRQTVAPLPVPASVAFGNGRYAAGGLRSTDGISWTADGFVPPTAQYRLRSVFCHDRFFFFETNPRADTPTTPRSVFVSLDGHSLVQTLSMPTTAGQFGDVAYGNGRFVLTATSGTYTSTDGVNWVLATTTSPGSNLAFGLGVFAAVNGQSIQTSPDGITWTTRYTVPPYVPGTSVYPIHTLGGITFGRDRFVALYNFLGKVIESTGSAPLISTDGVTWTMGSAGFGISAGAPTFVNGLFALSAGGTSYRTANDRYLHLSYDGFTWSTAILSFPLGSLAGDAGTLVGADDASGGEAINLYQATLPAATPPVITASAIADAAITRGSQYSLSVVAQSSSPVSYQWRHNGVPIPGATASGYTIEPSTGTSGTYDVVVTGLAGRVVSSSATITLADSWLSNVSSRAFVGTGEDVLIQGFVVRTGPGNSLSLLARAIGPTLGQFGVQEVLADPVLALVRQSDGTELAHNDNWPWENSFVTPPLQPFFSFVGAFDLPSGSADAALTTYQPTGNYSFVVSGANGGTGAVLSELYDYTGPSSGRLTNLSARARAGSGDRTLILGFVIVGDRPLKLLLRGIGPALASQGIAHPLANPKITLYTAAGVEIHNNDTWHHAANVAELRAATATVGAFPLAEDSNDAAMLESLPPGIYTLVVNSQDDSSGIALAEIYAVAP